MGQLKSEYRISLKEEHFERAIVLFRDETPISTEWLYEIGGEKCQHEPNIIEFEWFSVTSWPWGLNEWMVWPTLYSPPIPFGVVNTRGQFLSLIRLAMNEYQ